MMLLDEEDRDKQRFEASNAEAVLEKMWMQMQAETMERCIVGDHRRNATTTPTRTTDTVLESVVSHRADGRKTPKST